MFEIKSRKVFHLKVMITKARIKFSSPKRISFFFLFSSSHVTDERIWNFGFAHSPQRSMWLDNFIFFRRQFIVLLFILWHWRDFRFVKAQLSISWGNFRSNDVDKKIFFLDEISFFCWVRLALNFELCFSWNEKEFWF